MPRQHRPFAGHPCAARHPELIRRAQVFLGLAIGSSTRATYSTGVKSYVRFASTHQLAAPFPASVATLCLWLSAVASPPQSLVYGTCKVYLAAVITHHVEMGFAHPLQADSSSLLDRVLAGIKRASAPAVQPKLPITTAMLQSMRAHLDLQQRRDVLVWAMMWTATAGMLRISEFALTSTNDTERALRMHHVRFFDHGGEGHSLADVARILSPVRIRYALIHLDASKSDPLRFGVDVTISAPSALCALCGYAKFCTSSLVTASTPFFHFDDGTAVHRQWLMKRVDELLVRTGYNPRSYSSHSFRKGGAASLQAAGVGDAAIRQLGRWKSDAFNLYVRHPHLDAVVEFNSRLS